MASKQAACLNCRKSKIRCRRNHGASVCDRCENHRLECVIPPYHIGRQKGVKNKRTGLEKAVHQIQEAIKKQKSEPSPNKATLQQLQRLLDDANGGLPEAAESLGSTPTRPSTAGKDEASDSSDDQFALADAENPLQLLARASDLRLTTLSDPNAGTPSTGKIDSASTDPLDIHRFFLPIKAKHDLGPELDPIDIGLVSLEEADELISFFHANLAHTRWGLDPLVHTLHFVRSQSALLFTALLLAASRFKHSASALAKRLLNHRQFLVKQIIYKRFRSVEIVLALMVSLPWMHPLEHAADDDTGVFISMAISIGLDLSLNKIIFPTWSYSSELLSRLPKADCIDARRALAMDGFDEVDPKTEWGQRLLRRRERVWIALFVLERGVCLARGRPTIFPITPLVKHCDKWHTTVAGNDPQDGPLISMAVLRRDLDDLLDTIRARCDSYRVIDVGTKVAQEIEHMIDKFFADWFADWTMSAPETPDELPRSLPLPPYVEILVTHTRLSTYSSVINHPTAPMEVKKQFRASALSSALNVMRAAIQGESRLMSMPNNTVIMICFAACVALKLSTPSRRNSARASAGNGTGMGFGLHTDAVSNVRSTFEDPTGEWDGRIGATPSRRESGRGNYENGNGAGVHAPAHNHHNLAPSVRALIEETATVLSRIGGTPPHRNGTGVVYGKYLREIVRQAPSVAPDPEAATLLPALPGLSPNAVGQFALTPGLQHTSPQFTHAGAYGLGAGGGVAGWDEPLHFSAMSSNQVTEAIMNVSGFDTAMFEYPIEGVEGLDWGNWAQDFGFQS